MGVVKTYKFVMQKKRGMSVNFVCRVSKFKSVRLDCCWWVRCCSELIVEDGDHRLLCVKTIFVLSAEHTDDRSSYIGVTHIPVYRGRQGSSGSHKAALVAPAMYGVPGSIQQTELTISHTLGAAILMTPSTSLHAT